jgi:hypothetical protein
MVTHLHKLSIASAIQHQSISTSSLCVQLPTSTDDHHIHHSQLSDVTVAHHRGSVTNLDSGNFRTSPLLPSAGSVPDLVGPGNLAFCSLRYDAVIDE